MAVCCDGAGAGADLSSGLFVVGSARYAHKLLSSMNCDVAVSLKAKTSRSNIVHMVNTLIGFRNMQPS